MPYIIRVKQFRDAKSGAYLFLFKVSVEGPLTLLSHVSALNLKFERAIHENKVIFCSDWFESLRKAEEKISEITKYLQSRGERTLIEKDIFEEIVDF
ncbi:MAG: hypothetical protein ACTSYM_11585 [Candidatus Baldrarchaeia archaeon]